MFAETAYAITYQEVVGKVQTTINDGLIPLVGGAALIFFLYGLVKFLAAAENEGERQNGRVYMMWGLIGLLVMVGVWGFVDVLTGSIFGENFTGLPQFK